MPNDVPSRLVGELTSFEVKKRLHESSILCLPIGSIEQHGPHLPLNTDVLLANEFARRIIGRWGDEHDLWQLPTISISLAREHEWALGTLSLSTTGITALIHDLGREIARSLPPRNLAIINGHGGNRGVLEALAHDLRADYRLNVGVFHPSVWGNLATEAAMPEIHGGKNETSMMLAFAPHLVRRNEIARLNRPPSASLVRTTILDADVSWPWSSQEQPIADMGVIGDAAAATAEFGERLLENIVERAGPVLQQLRNRQHSQQS